MKTSEKIIGYIKKHRQVTASELTDYLEISDRAVRKQLKKLYEADVLGKIGKPPRVFYFLKKVQPIVKSKLNKKVENFLEENYLIITPSGEKIEGVAAFIYWCNKHKLDIQKTADEYIETMKKYSKYKKQGVIDGLSKFKETFEKVYLDKLYYLDFYSIERFGKTKLGQSLLYGKQSGNKALIKEICKRIKPVIEKIIKKHKIEAIAYIPWTVKRDIQFMKELEKNLGINLKRISIEKVKTEVIVPQKSLSKLNDRMEKARNTIIVNDRNNYNNVLLIDDAIGSGATLNETAKQMKEKKLSNKIIGVSITGSFKGFDVISEV